jgi:hypothetical protein
MTEKEIKNTKTCKKCKVEQLLDQFTKLRAKCRTCRSEHNKNYYEKNKKIRWHYDPKPREKKESQQ